jgi:phosphatidate cytidylyltransferase
MNNLISRILTALVGGAVVITGMFWNVYSFSLLFLLISFLTTYELLHLLRQQDESNQTIWKYSAIMMLLYLLLVAVPIWSLDSAWYVLSIPVTLYFFVTALFQPHTEPFRIISRNMTAMVYTVIPFTLLIYIAYDGKSFEPLPVLGLFLLTWIYDIGAYFAGSAFGRHKLFERVSPKKSWEGVGGGIILCAGLTFGLAEWIPKYSLIDWLFIAGITVVFGTLGDLSESLLKRSIGVKDSGNWLPGHGGFLDRFDALIFNIPAIYTYLKLFTE